MVIAVLVVAAFAVAKPQKVEDAGPALSAWFVGTVALMFGSAALFVPMHWGWGAVAALLALDATMLSPTSC